MADAVESVRAVLCEASSTCRFERDASAAPSPASVRPVREGELNEGVGRVALNEGGRGVK